MDTLHDTLRGRRGSFRGAIDLARSVQSVGGVVRINSVITRSLAAGREQLTELVRDVIDLSPNEWMLIQPHPANEKEFYFRHEISGDVFGASVERARSVLRETSQGRVLLLTRDIERYSQYWLIYPDGILAQHTGGSNDSPGVSLTAEDLDAIQNHLGERQQRPAPQCFR